MSFKAITDYRANWQIPNNSGDIHVKVDGEDWGDLNISASAEYLVALTLLQGGKTLYVNQNRTVLTTDP